MDAHPPPSSPSSFRTVAALVVLSICVGVTYAPAARLGWVWDDRGLVVHNEVLSAPTWANVFGRDLWCCTDGDATPYYRPVMTLTLLLDRLVAGTSPAFAHLQSVGWHLIAVGLLYGWLRPRFGPARATLGATILAFHPLASEAVLWVAARNDLLVAVGVLGTLLALDRRRPILAGLAALFAFLAKESALSLVPVIALWAWAEGRVRPRDVVGVGLAGALALGLRANATLGDIDLGTVDPGWTADGLARVGLLSVSWITAPWPLTATAGLARPWSSLLAPPASIGIVASLVLLGVVASRTGRIAAASVSSAMLFAAPALGALRLYGTLGERYLYLPLGMLTVAIAAAWPAERARAAVGVSVALFCVTFPLLQIRTAEWTSDTTLFAAAWRRSPDAYSGYQLAMTRRATGDDTGALALLEASLAAVPRSPIACRYVADTARRVLPPAEFLARLPDWTAAGCRVLPGFDGPVATQLVAWRLWPELTQWLAESSAPDSTGRLASARIAAALNDGDLLGAAALEESSEGDSAPSERRDRVATLLLNRGP